MAISQPETGADLMLATDPDADRVGIAMKCPDGSYELVSGNEMGVLLLDYICAGRIEKGTMPEKPVAVMSIVSTPLADKVAEHYGVELRHTLTGFKWIGDQIAQLEAAGETDRFIFGFEESYGYLAGPYVRDKDAVVGSMLICEMAAYYRSIGSRLTAIRSRVFPAWTRWLASWKICGRIRRLTLQGIRSSGQLTTRSRKKPVCRRPMC